MAQPGQPFCFGIDVKKWEPSLASFYKSSLSQEPETESPRIQRTKEEFRQDIYLLNLTVFILKLLDAEDRKDFDDKCLCTLLLFSEKLNDFIVTLPENGTFNGTIREIAEVMNRPSPPPSSGATTGATGATAAIGALPSTGVQGKTGAPVGQQGAPEGTGTGSSDFDVSFLNDIAKSMFPERVVAWEHIREDEKAYETFKEEYINHFRNIANDNARKEAIKEAMQKLEGQLSPTTLKEFTESLDMKDKLERITKSVTGGALSIPDGLKDILVKVFTDIKSVRQEDVAKLQAHLAEKSTSLDAKLAENTKKLCEMMRTFKESTDMENLGKIQTCAKKILEKLTKQSTEGTDLQKASQEVVEHLKKIRCCTLKMLKDKEKTKTEKQIEELKARVETINDINMKLQALPRCLSLLKDQNKASEERVNEVIEQFQADVTEKLGEIDKQIQAKVRQAFELTSHFNTIYDQPIVAVGAQAPVLSSTVPVTAPLAAPAPASPAAALPQQLTAQPFSGIEQRSVAPAEPSPAAEAALRVLDHVPLEKRVTLTPLREQSMRQRLIIEQDPSATPVPEVRQVRQGTSPSSHPLSSNTTNDLYSIFKRLLIQIKEFQTLDGWLSTVNDAVAQINEKENENENENENEKITVLINGVFKAFIYYNLLEHKGTGNPATPAIKADLSTLGPQNVTSMKVFLRKHSSSNFFFNAISYLYITNAVTALRERSSMISKNLSDVFPKTYNISKYNHIEKYLQKYQEQTTLLDIIPLPSFNIKELNEKSIQQVLTSEGGDNTPTFVYNLMYRFKAYALDFEPSSFMIEIQRPIFVILAKVFDILWSFESTSPESFTPNLLDESLFIIKTSYLNIFKAAIENVTPPTSRTNDLFMTSQVNLIIPLIHIIKLMYTSVKQTYNGNFGKNDLIAFLNKEIQPKEKFHNLLEGLQKRNILHLEIPLVYNKSNITYGGGSEQEYDNQDDTLPVPSASNPQAAVSAAKAVLKEIQESKKELNMIATALENAGKKWDDLEKNLGAPHDAVPLTDGTASTDDKLVKEKSKPKTQENENPTKNQDKQKPNDLSDKEKDEITGLYSYMNQEGKQTLAEIQKLAEDQKAKIRKVFNRLMKIIEREPNYQTERKFVDIVSALTNAVEGDFNDRSKKGLINDISSYVSDITSQFNTKLAKIKPQAEGIEKRRDYDVRIQNARRDPYRFDETLKRVGLQGGAYEGYQQGGGEIDTANNINAIMTKVIAPLETLYKTRMNPAFALANTVSPMDNLFTKIMYDYKNDRDTDDMKAKQKLVNSMRANNLLPDEVLAVNSTDKTVFVFVTLFIRLFALTVSEYLIERGTIKTMLYAVLTYLILFTLILVAFVLFVNLDMYRLRIVFNYVNFHHNAGYFYMYLVLLWTIGAFMFLIMYKLNFPYAGIKISAISEEEKIQLISRLEMLTMIVWVILSVIVAVN